MREKFSRYRSDERTFARQLGGQRLPGRLDRLFTQEDRPEILIARDEAVVSGCLEQALFGVAVVPPAHRITWSAGSVPMIGVGGRARSPWRSAARGRGGSHRADYGRKHHPGMGSPLAAYAKAGPERKTISEWRADQIRCVRRSEIYGLRAERTSRRHPR